MSILECAKSLGVRHNVSFRVIDVPTRTVVQEHIGHNAATDTMLTGIAHYLKGDGVLNQSTHMLTEYIPRYISLGTMGLMDQREDADGLPASIGPMDYTGMYYKDLTNEQRISIGWPTEITEHFNYIHPEYPDKGAGWAYQYGQVNPAESDVLRFTEYMLQAPGYGADGTDVNNNNNRPLFGLGYPYSWSTYGHDHIEPGSYKDCTELISLSYPRSKITYREIVPTTHSELDGTIDIIFSAMISTGALKHFRHPQLDENGNIKRDENGNIIYNPYIFITEAGLWSRPDFIPSEPGDNNGLLAAYRICPTDESNQDMRDIQEGGYEKGKYNRDKLRQCILKVGRNQVVQVIWKIQIGALKQLSSIHSIYQQYDNNLYWQIYDEQMRSK